MRVLITGGAGFIGSTLSRKLIDHKVMVYDNLSKGSRENIPTGVEFIEGDIRDVGGMLRVLKGVDSVIHLAAYGSVVESVDDPMANFDINAYGTLNVLNAARQSGVSSVILASTGGALIGDAVPPVNELSLPRPISPYGASKLCGEAYAHVFAKSYGLKTIALRFANVYGPNSWHKKGAVTIFMKSILDDVPIPIYGDGKATRDYLYVDDLCHGICLALGATPEIPSGEVIHLASGNETSVLGLAELIRSAAGVPKHPIVFRESRKGEVERNFATYDKAKHLLGFEPGRTLREGIAQTWQWYLEKSQQSLASSSF